MIRDSVDVCLQLLSGDRESEVGRGPAPHPPRRFESTTLSKMAPQDDPPWSRSQWLMVVDDAVNDPARLAAVHHADVLDSGPEEYLDRLSRIASDALGVPWVFVTIVDASRSFWKSAAGAPREGIAYGENRVEESFCQYVIGADGPVVIQDARDDRRSEGNPSIESMGVVAWCGYPIRSHGGEVLGTFCAVDRRPRLWTNADRTLMEGLASAAAGHLQLRAALVSARTATAALDAELQAREVIVQRAVLLARFTAELIAARTVRDVANAVTEHGPAVLGATYVNVAVVNAARHCLDLFHSEAIATMIAQEWTTIGLNDSVPLADAARSGAPVLLGNLEMVRERYPTLVDVTIEAGLVATASMPLHRADSSVAGVIGAAWAEPVAFSPLERSLLATVTGLCAQALDRAMLADANRNFLSRLHAALLPPRPNRPRLDIVTTYVPANTDIGIGGDWYDIIDLGPDRTAVVVGDVCGHGIEAAASMATLRGSINVLLRSNPDRLDEVINRAESLLDLPRPDFVATVAIHIIDTSKGLVSYVSAGHPPAIVLAPDGTATLLEGGRRAVLGVHAAPPVPLTNDFPIGATLVSYTDGLVEHGRNIDHGINILIGLLRSGGSTVTDISAAVTTSPLADSDDDIVLVIARSLPD